MDFKFSPTKPLVDTALKFRAYQMSPVTYCDTYVDQFCYRDAGYNRNEQVNVSLYATDAECAILYEKALSYDKVTFTIEVSTGHKYTFRNAQIVSFAFNDDFNVEGSRTAQLQLSYLDFTVDQPEQPRYNNLISPKYTATFL